MSMGKRVTGSLGLLLAAIGVMGLVAASSCAPSHDPDHEGPPSVVKVLGFSPDDPTVNATMYVTDDPTLMQNCDYDFDAGQGGMDASIGTTWGFRMVLSELIDGDQVEMLDDAGVGSEAYSGFVEITDAAGGTVTSTLDPTLQLTPDTLSTIYQPAGGSGCYGSVETEDIIYGNPLPGPALITYLAGVDSLPSNTELKLVLHAENGGNKIVDKGGTQMAGDFSVSFVTDPLFVDCFAPDACNVMPSVNPDDQPVDVAGEGIETVDLIFLAPIGDASGIYLYDTTDLTQPMADIEPLVDGNYVSLAQLDTNGDPGAIAFTDNHTYWVVVTSDVLDMWGVPAEMIPGDTGCDDLATAGITVANCVWAGSFTVAPAAATDDGGV
jgi:hypothetical protein